MQLVICCVIQSPRPRLQGALALQSPAVAARVQRISLSYPSLTALGVIGRHAASAHSEFTILLFQHNKVQTHLLLLLLTAV